MSKIIDSLARESSRVYELKVFTDGRYLLTVTWITPDENDKVFEILKLTVKGYRHFSAKIYEVNKPVTQFSNINALQPDELVSLFNDIRAHLGLRRDCELAKAFGLSACYFSKLKKGAHPFPTTTAQRMIDTTLLEQTHPELAEKLLAISVDRRKG
ncbi:hypothetical protein KKG46_01355 [Patescibacteria group bacterium]|nr:hypothetical protein [Patescibacteria group bacterium]